MNAVEEGVAEVFELGRVETDLPRAREAEKETVTGTSRSEDNVPKEALRVLHHEAFFRYREDFKCHEAETRELAKKKDAYKLLSEKLQAETEAARKEHVGLVKHVIRIFEISDDDSDTLANDSNPQVQKRLDQIGQLQVEVDTVKAEAKEWKKNMNHLASEKETAWAQLASAEVQLRAIKEKYSVQANTIEGLHSRLASAISGQEALAKEIEATKLEVVVTKTEADDKVAQFKADAKSI
ncbi:uncharacterized protein [Nicotiana tomentosiformis]|uniref:uncharacterized protein n=1 Tax=Nicotiana tomentosiformis TaxID=4098 RepID=UPI00388CB246